MGHKYKFIGRGLNTDSIICSSVEADLLYLCQPFKSYFKIQLYFFIKIFKAGMMSAGTTLRWSRQILSVSRELAWFLILPTFNKFVHRKYTIYVKSWSDYNSQSKPKLVEILYQFVCTPRVTVCDDPKNLDLLIEDISHLISQKLSCATILKLIWIFMCKRGFLDTQNFTDHLLFPPAAVGVRYRRKKYEGKDSW